MVKFKPVAFFFWLIVRGSIWCRVSAAAGRTNLGLEVGEAPAGSVFDSILRSAESNQFGQKEFDIEVPSIR